MRVLPKDLLPQDSSAISSSIDRRQFLATSGGLLAAAVPGNSLTAGATEPRTASAPGPRPAGNQRKSLKRSTAKSRK